MIVPEGRPRLGAMISCCTAGEFVFPLPSLDTGDGRPTEAPAPGIRSIDFRDDAFANGGALRGKEVFVMGDSYCTRFESSDVAVPAVFGCWILRCPSLTALDLFTAGFCVCAGTWPSPGIGTYPCIHLFCR